MQHLLLSSLVLFSRIRDAIQESIELVGKDEPIYAKYAAKQMHFYAERCQSTNILLQEWKLWDSDILFRPALEGATRFLFVTLAPPEERVVRIGEYSILLNEIESLLRTDKVRIAARHADEDSAALLNGAAVSPLVEAELRARWPQTKKKALKQRWSFSEIVKQLKLASTDYVDLTSYESLLHSYGLSSHLIHADQTAITLMVDRATREAKERRLLEQAHYARLATQQTMLLFVCWRALHRANPITSVHQELAQALESLELEASKYHRDFAVSQTDLRDQTSDRS